MPAAERSTHRRVVPADLVEATPSPWGQWLLASPLIGFLAWAWLDLFHFYSPLPWRWLNIALGSAALLILVILPLGVAAHWLITAAPRLFQNAGWDVVPLEPVSDAERYQVRYVARGKQRAAATWSRVWIRAAQGWVYLEIAAILLGGLLLIPLFLSAVDFGFGA